MKRSITIEFDEERGRGILNDANEATWVPSAHSSRVFSCGDDGCGNAHMVFYGPDGKPEYEAVINKKLAARIYEVAAGIGDLTADEPSHDRH